MWYVSYVQMSYVHVLRLPRVVFFVVCSNFEHMTKNTTGGTRGDVFAGKVFAEAKAYAAPGGGGEMKKTKKTRVRLPHLSAHPVINKPLCRVRILRKRLLLSSRGLRKIYAEVGYLCLPQRRGALWIGAAPTTHTTPGKSRRTLST